MSIRANYHTHSTFCDGKNTPREIVEEALKLGMKYLGFSGHMDADVHMDFEKYTTEIRGLQEEFANKIEILCGVELDNLYNPEYANDMDFVIGSTHFLDVNFERPLSIDDKPEDVILLCNEFYGGDYYKLCKNYFELEAKILDKFPCTFIGHFDLVKKFNDSIHFVDENDSRYLQPAFEAMNHLASRGVMFEVNTRQASCGRIYPGKELLEHLNEIGGEIIINSDAHKASDLMWGFDYAVEYVKTCGFKHINYLTLERGKAQAISVGI